MKIIYQSYYNDFKCIADKCQDTCCAGWEIDIDKKCYEYYANLEGEFGEKIRKNIKTYEENDEDMYEEHGFILDKERRCPFLNENNLCDIILKLGEEAISYVCKNTPRNYLEYAGAREISLSPSCPEAARLLFEDDAPIELVEKDNNEKLSIEEDIEDIEFGKWIREARDRCLNILSDRGKNIKIRLWEVLQFSLEVQKQLNEENLSPISDIEINKKSEEIQENKEKIYYFFLKRFETLNKLDSINEEWDNYRKELCSTFVENENGKDIFFDTFVEYCKFVRDNSREYEYEKMAQYFTFLMVSRSVDDWNFWSKTQFVLTAVLMIRDMDILSFYKKGTFDLDDRIRTVKLFAKEVEHSQENMDVLDDEFLFEETYKCEQLTEQILQW